MARETKTDLLERIERLQAENKRLAEDRIEYFDRMTNAKILADRLAAENAELREKLAKLEARQETTLTEESFPQNPRRGRPVQISEETREQIRTLREQGHSVRYIASKTNVSTGMVCEIARGKR